MMIISLRQKINADNALLCLIIFLSLISHWIIFKSFVIHFVYPQRMVKGSKQLIDLIQEKKQLQQAITKKS